MTREIYGTFNGENMVGTDGQTYPVPANYASKSKLLQGDGLKLVVGDDGSYKYKQSKPTAYMSLVAEVLEVDHDGHAKIKANNKVYRVIQSSVSYFRFHPGMEVMVRIPNDPDATWAAAEAVIPPVGKDLDQEM